MQRLVLGSDLDIAHAAALKADLQTVPPGPVELDAEAVGRTDASGLQLLLAFVRQREAQGQSPAWRNVSETLQRDAQDLGVAALLNLNNRSEEAQS